MPNVTATTFTWLGGLFKLPDGTPLTQVVDVDFSGDKRSVEAVTSADNSDGADRKLGRTKDYGSCTVTLWYNPQDPTHKAFLALDDGLEHPFQAVYANNVGTRSFNAVVESSSGHKLQIAKGTQKVVKLDISGPIVDS